MYLSPNFKTKEALKGAVAQGDHVSVFQDDVIVNEWTGFVVATKTIIKKGTISIEGPDWYARVTIEDSKITKVR